MFSIEKGWNSDDLQDTLNNQLFGNVGNNEIKTTDKPEKKKKRKSVNKEEKPPKKKKSTKKSDSNLSPIKPKTIETAVIDELEKSLVKENESNKNSPVRKNVISKEEKPLKDSENTRLILSNKTENSPDVTKTKIKGKKEKKCNNTDNIKTNKTQKYANAKLNAILNATLEPNSEEKVLLEESKTHNEKITETKNDPRLKFNVSDSKQPSAGAKYNKFQAKLNRKLEGGHFRWINEQLYTSHSSDAVKMFRESSHLFHVYHKGFATQVQHWPVNPVDVIVDYINQRDTSLVVGDFGCGDAKIASSCVDNQIHSFDLVATNEKVTACDMRKVPLPNEALDLAVFCLSLMGKNVDDFINEAHRVLKTSGILKIAEVKSRFDNIDQFVKKICLFGFKLIHKDEKNKMFVMLDFEKLNERPTQKKDVGIILKPCIYKRR